SAASIAFHVGGDVAREVATRADRDGSAESDPALAARARRERSIVEECRDGRTHVAVPLVHDDDVIGVAEIVTCLDQKLLAEEQLLFRAIANRAGALLAHGTLAVREQSTASELAEAAATLEAVFEHAPVGLSLFDRELRYTRVNRVFTELSGLSASEHLGRRRAEVLPSVAAQSDAVLRRVLETGEAIIDRELAAETPARPGETREWALSAFPIRVDGRTIGVGIVVRETTAQKRAERALAARARQQSELAALGLRALRGGDLQALFDDVVHTVSRTLGVELAKILELRPGGDELVLRAGIGWREGLVGHATVPADTGSQAGFTMFSRQPIIVRDLRRETRFHGPALLLDHGVVSGVSAVIEAPGTDGAAFGVIGAHTATERELTEDDAAFVQSVANIVGAAVMRARWEQQVAFERRWGETHRLLADVSDVLASSLDAEARLRDVVSTVVPRLAERGIALLRRPDGTLACSALESTGTETGDAGADARSAMELPTTEQLERYVTDQPAAIVGAEDDRAQLLATIFGSAPAPTLVAPVRLGDAIVGAIALSSMRAPLDAVATSIVDEICRRWALAVENAELYRRTQDAVRAREEILAIVSHDLRSPLHAIQLASASMRAAAAATAARAAPEKALEIVDRAVLRMRRLIDDLLDFASVRSGRLSLTPAPRDPRAIVAEALETFRFQAEERSVRLVGESGAPLRDVLVDGERILQCISNLISNAMRVTPPGGTITIGAELRGDEVLFVVRDTGPGIARAELERIFDRYVRGATAAYHGSGLGLAICRGIVEAHGGRIWAESVAGEGASLYFTAPIAR
nr:ATP-binding protein [Myxococcota bacterium]